MNVCVIKSSKTVTWADDPENHYKRDEAADTSPYEGTISAHSDTNASEHSVNEYNDNGTHANASDAAQYQSDYVEANSVHATDATNVYAMADSANVSNAMDQQLYANQQYYYTGDGQYAQQQAEPYAQYEQQQTEQYDPQQIHPDYLHDQTVCTSFKHLILFLFLLFTALSLPLSFSCVSRYESEN